jgi:hypothetical protein
MRLNKLAYILLLLVSIQGFSQKNLYSSLTIPDSLRQAANAVIRLNETNISIESQRELTIIQKRIVTVLNEKGNFAVEAYSGYDKYFKIKKIEAKVYDKTGNEIKKFRKKDFVDHSAVDGGTLYSDSRVLFMNYTPIAYPYTVEFLCEVETSSTASIPSWRPLNYYYVSVVKDVYSLKDNANLGLRFKEKNLDKFNVQKTNTPTSLNYTLENTKLIKPEVLSPSFAEFTPQVLVAVENFHFYGVDGKAKNWLEFGNWINNSLLAGRDIVTEETKEHIIKITSGIEDPIERAKKVFEYVQNNTRYISVQVGIGGVQPIPALEVDQLKYGDCKGLTNYTQSLLKLADVSSYYTIVQAGSQNRVDLEEDFASLAQGNHIILAIPDDDDILWLDCTSQIHPFNFIGDFTDNRNVLVIKPDSSEIVKTKIYPDSLNYQSTLADIKLNSDGSIEAKIERGTKGTQYDSRFPLERQADKDIIEYYKEHWGYVNNLEVAKYSFDNDKSKIEFKEFINIQANNYASLNGDRLLFKPNAFNKNTFIPDRYRNRKRSLDIQRGYLDEDSFTFIIPEGYQIEALPNNVSIKNKFGEYKFEMITNEKTISYHRKLLIKNGKYPSNEYNEYRDFRKKIAKGDNLKIVLKSVK